MAKLKEVLSYVPGWSLAAVLVWLLMLAAAALTGTLVPSSLRLTQGAVCAEGATLEVREVRPRAGKVNISVDCVEPDGTRHTGLQFRAIATLGTFFFVPVFLSLFAWAFLRKEPPGASNRLGAG